MSKPTPLERAKKVLAENAYFVLATNDREGPWAAALAFTLVAPSSLCFFSQRKSRHGQALAQRAKVAGVIYNSMCAPEDAESIQFSGTGEICHTRELITAVLAAGADGNEPSDSIVNEHLNSDSVALYRIDVSACWVLDQEAYEANGVDARETVDVLSLFSPD